MCLSSSKTWGVVNWERVLLASIESVWIKQRLAMSVRFWCISTLLGRINEFDGTKEDWQQFVKRVNHFFDANGINNALVFLAVRGPTTYTLVRKLVMPAKPGEESYNKLVKVLKDHFNPTPPFSISWSLEEAWWDCGYVCFQTVLDGRVLQFRCLVGRHVMWLICGINNGKIQQKLLAEKKLTLTTAIEMDQGTEMAANNAKKIGECSLVKIGQSLLLTGSRVG